MNHHAPDFKIVGVVNFEYGIFLIILILPIRFLIILKNRCKDNNNSAFIATFVLIICGNPQIKDSKMIT